MEETVFQYAVPFRITFISVNYRRHGRMDGRRRRQQISIRQNHPVMDVFVLNILDRTFTYTATFLMNYFHLHLNELMPSCERASACTLQ